MLLPILIQVPLTKYTLSMKELIIDVSQLDMGQFAKLSEGN